MDIFYNYILILIVILTIIYNKILFCPKNNNLIESGSTVEQVL